MEHRCNPHHVGESDRCGHLRSVDINGDQFAPIRHRPSCRHTDRAARRDPVARRLCATRAPARIRRGLRTLAHLRLLAYRARRRRRGNSRGRRRARRPRLAAQRANGLGCSPARRSRLRRLRPDGELLAATESAHVHLRGATSLAALAAEALAADALASGHAAGSCDGKPESRSTALAATAATVLIASFGAAPVAAELCAAAAIGAGQGRRARRRGVVARTGNPFRKCPPSGATRSASSGRWTKRAASRSARTNSSR